MSDANQSVASLTDELLVSVVEPLAAVDVHTHINGQDPAAKDIGEIIFYHYIVSELEASGVGRETLAGARTAEEKVDLFLKFYKRLSNTITFWCLRRVLELHGIGAGTELSRQALLEANSKVLRTHADPAWPRRTLADTHHVCKTALTLNITEKPPEYDTQTFFGTLRLDEVLSVVSAEALGRFRTVTGKSLSSLEAFEKAAGEAVAGFARGGGKGLSLGLPPEEDFLPGGRPEAAKLFDRVVKGESLSLPECVCLHSYLLDFFSGLAAETRLPMQLLLGVRRPLPGQAAVVAVAPGLVSRYAALFHKFREVNFDIFLASAPHSQEAISTAKSYPNLSLTGFWWYAFSPPYIRTILTERLMALPAVKLHAFFSDAYNVEWSAGKLALLRRELSRVLAELLVSHYLTESHVAELASTLLHENAMRFYKL